MVMTVFGAKIVLTSGSEGMKTAIAQATKMQESDPKRYWLAQQFENPANPAIHAATTGPEIFEDTKGEVDVLVSGVGTGGTITGVSKYIKGVSKKPFMSVAVEPVTSPVITQALNKQPLKPGPHKIQGIGAGFIPKVLDLSIIDRVETVTNDEAFETSRALVQKEGILSGIFFGVVVVVVIRLARLPEFKDKTIVAVLPDSGERYLSTILFQNNTTTASTSSSTTTTACANSIPFTATSSASTSVGLANAATTTQSARVS
jgi:cysteine synthase A